MSDRLVDAYAKAEARLAKERVNARNGNRRRQVEAGKKFRAAHPEVYAHGMKFEQLFGSADDGYPFHFGEFRGDSLVEVAEQFPGYINWMVGEADFRQEVCEKVVEILEWPTAKPRGDWRDTKLQRSISGPGQGFRPLSWGKRCDLPSREILPCKYCAGAVHRHSFKRITVIHCHGICRRRYTSQEFEELGELRREAGSRVEY